MAQARDVGSRITVVYCMGNVSRATYGFPVVQVMNDLASLAMLLLGNPEEGTVLGRIRPQEGMPGRGQFRLHEASRKLTQVMRLNSAVSFDQS